MKSFNVIGALIFVSAALLIVSAAVSVRGSTTTTVPTLRGLHNTASANVIKCPTNVNGQAQTNCGGNKNNAAAGNNLSAADEILVNDVLDVRDVLDAVLVIFSPS